MAPSQKTFGQIPEHNKAAAKAGNSAAGRAALKPAPMSEPDPKRHAAEKPDELQAEPEQQAALWRPLP